MNNTCQICITSAVESALKKLSRAKIPVYNVKKRGNKLYFEVGDEYLKKVFAIFSHTCYNINVIEKSRKTKFTQFIVNRIGLILGCVIFVAAVLIGNCFIFKIEVTGSGNYLESQILTIIDDAGIRVGSFYKSLDKPLALSRIMALPDVTFCSIDRSGSALIIDVQTDSENNQKVSYNPLYSDVDGELKKLVVLCGSAEATVGQKIVKGQKLIGAYSLLSDGTTTPCLAVGYAEIECTNTLSYSADYESEENKTAALSAINLYTDKPQNVTCSVKRDGAGVIYEVTFCFIHTVSINME